MESWLTEGMSQNAAKDLLDTVELTLLSIDHYEHKDAALFINRQLDQINELECRDSPRSSWFV